MRALRTASPRTYWYTSRSLRTPERPLRLLLGAFGDPGHAFPLIALGAELAARGHEVVLQTWARWEDDVRAAGMRFEPAPEYPVFPTRERPLKPYEAVLRATTATRPLVADFAPDAVVADILTLACTRHVGALIYVGALQQAREALNDATRSADAATPHTRALLASDQRGAREREERRLGQRGAHVECERVILTAVGLVREHDDIRAIG